MKDNSAANSHSVAVRSRPRRLFLIVVLGFALGAVGWPLIKIVDVRAQYASKEAIEKLGGEAYFDYQMYYDGDYERRYDGKRSLITDPWFEQIKFVDLSDTQITDSELRWISQLGALEELDLSRTEITGVGLKFCTNHRVLDVLNLANSDVKDQFLGFIPRSVRHLNLSGTQVTDSGIQHLVQLREVEGINLERTRVTQKGVDLLRSKLRSGSIKWNGSWHASE